MMSNAEIRNKSIAEIKRLLFLSAFGCTGAVAKQANQKIEPWVVETLSK